MSKRAAFLTGLLALCLLAVPACQVSTPAATAITPSHAPTRIYSSTPVPSPSLTLTLAPAPTQVIPSTIPTLVIHLIQPGDTLLGLASKYDVPMAAIQLQNGMDESTMLYAGDVLVIPPASDWEGASRFWVVYMIKAGETLAEIAQTYDLEVAVLLQINGLVDPGELQLGDQLVLPLEAPAAAYLPTPTYTPTPIPPTATVTPIFPTEAIVPTLASAAPPASLADWPHETARLINEVRAARGLPPYVYNETLAQAAQAHADDCAQRGWCSHTGSDGSDVKTRIVRAGYEPSGWAECWAQSRDPNHAVEMWLDEVPPNDPHVRTLLSTWVTEIGVGVAQTSWGYYFIADFGRP